MDNTKAFIIFIIIALTVYIGINFYVYRRTMQAAAPVGIWIWLLRITLIAGILSFPLGRFIIECNCASSIGKVLIWIGSFWLAVMVYGFLICLLADLVRFIDMLTGWLPGWFLENQIRSGRLVFAMSSVMMVMLLTGGFIRTLYPKTPEYTIELANLPDEIEEYRIVMFADTHFGTIVGEKRLNRMVDQVNEQYPDLVLIVGDLVDESADRMPWLIEPLSRIEAADGVFAVNGNHEFYVGIKQFDELAREAGIRLLMNQSAVIDGKVTLIGLDDESGGHSLNAKKIAIEKLVKEVAIEHLPIILMHHTPSRMKEAEEAGVDLMLSGHVHEGQLWPVKYLAEAVYGVRTGLSEIGKMKFYLTSGAGTWGPPVRICATPEIVTLVLKRNS
ncbi:MAG: metallophosphoesterase [Calditrichaeota bacterium]|nr:metallophosphoesterase [Calditrichota bacterium]